MTHLISTLHDWAVVQALGKAPLYKQGRPKMNHLLTFLLQQYYVFDTDHWKDIQQFLLEYLGSNFDTIFTEPDLNRWLFTGNATNEATDHGALMCCNRPTQFMTTFYYLASSTRLNCDCEVRRLPDGSCSWHRDPQCVEDNKQLHTGDYTDWGCMREWLPGKKASKQARQLRWYACLQDPTYDAEAYDSVMVRLHLLAHAEFCKKVINPKHFWTIGQSQQLREYPPGFFKEDAARDTPGGHINHYRRMHKLPAGHRMADLKRFARQVIEQARAIKAAVVADVWAELPLCDEGIDEFRLRKVAWCPFVDVMRIAHDTQYHQWFHIPSNWSVADKLKATLREWLDAYLMKVEMWFPGLLLLPFAIGDLNDTARGPALARALIKAGCLQVEQPAWYNQWQPTTEIDIEAEQTIHDSIIAAGKAEYADVFGVTEGNKAAKEAAAKIAMEKRLKSGSLDTFGFLETITGNPAALKEFYTFALSGRQYVHEVNPCSACCCKDWCCRKTRVQNASPYIQDYDELYRSFKEHVLMCLTSQQKLEAFFKDYRHGVSKQANDDLKEAVFMTKQNTFKRAKAEQAAGIKSSRPTYTKKDALDRLKARIEAGNEHAAAQNDIVAEMAPHIGHGR